jgi:hypothetical protein
MRIAGLMRENYPCNDAAENYIYEQKRGMIHDRDMHARPVLFGLRLKQNMHTRTNLTAWLMRHSFLQREDNNIKTQF